MNRIPNPFRGMRLSSILTISGCLSVCGFSVYQAIDGQTFPTTATAVGAEVSRVMLPRDSSRTGLVNPGSPIPTIAAASPKSQVKLTPIEQLTVGKRVQADSPTAADLDLQFGTTVVSADWRKLTLLAPKRDGSTADVVLLRPLTWLNEQQAEVGGTVFISVPECGIDGHAEVLAIEPCPEIVPGEGRVITGTFRHQVSESISLSIAGQAEPILCTGNHPFWSEDRQDFVRADSLQPHETLRTTTGTTNVTSLGHIPGSTPVYNLEVHGTHVYHVGTSGVLVHNGNCPDQIIDAAFGFDGPLEQFARDVAAHTGRKVDISPFLKLADDGNLEQVLRQAMEHSRRNHLNYEKFEYERFLKWLRSGGPGSAPIPGSDNVANWEIYTLMTEYLHKTTFYGGKGSDFLPWPF